MKNKSEKVNQLTSFIDASTVYGVSSQHLNLLLDREKKRLRTQTSEKHGELLPPLSSFDDTQTNIEEDFSDDDGIGLNLTSREENEPFVAGDTRVGEFPILTSFHTLFVRLHNYVVGRLEEINPHWCNKKLFNEARMFGKPLMMYTT